MKLHYVILTILGSSTFLLSQNYKLDTNDCFLDIDKDDKSEWVLNFNKMNHTTRHLLKNETTHKLDSAHFWTNNGKSLAVYDFTVERDLSFKYDWDYDNNEWIPETFLCYHYDNEENLIRATYNLWDGELDNVSDNDPLILRTFEYNEDNLLIEYQVRGQTELLNNTLGNVSYYEYSDQGLLEEEFFYSWSVAEDSLRLVRKEEYSYNDSGFLDLYLKYENDSDRGYYATDSIIYTHQEDTELLDTETKYIKSNLSDEWIFTLRSIYHHNQDEKIEKIVRENLFNETFLLVDTLKYSYFDYGSLQEIANVATEYPYGYPIEATYDLSTYDYDGNVSIYKVQNIRTDFFGFPAYERNHMLIESKRYDNQNQFLSLSVISSGYYFYSEIKPSATVDIIEDAAVFSISPNPASDNIEIVSSEYSGEVHFSITDISGRRVIDQKTYPNEGIHISHLTPGIYIYTISDDRYKSTGKIVVE